MTSTYAAANTIWRKRHSGSRSHVARAGDPVGGVVNTITAQRLMHRGARFRLVARLAAQRQLSALPCATGPTARSSRRSATAERRPAGVADLDDVAGHREVEEPSGVVAVEVQAAVEVSVLPCAHTVASSWCR